MYLILAISQKLRESRITIKTYSDYHYPFQSAKMTTPFSFHIQVVDAACLPRHPDQLNREYRR